MPTCFEVAIGTDTVTALWYAADAAVSLQTTVVLGHGAGVSQLSSFMTYFANGLANRGADLVTFDFVYMERGRRLPDHGTKLEACYRAVIDATRTRVPSARTRLVIGGKSMGGRIASQVAAHGDNGVDVAGLVFLGYPLHPPGRPDRLRAAHLSQLCVPILFIQGARDPFGTPEELRPVLAGCQHARLHVVEGGDHSLKLRKKDATHPESVWDGIQDAIVRWLGTDLD